MKFMSINQLLVVLGIVDWAVIVAAVEVVVVTFVVATGVWLEIALVASEVALAELDRSATTERFRGALGANQQC